MTCCNAKDLTANGAQAAEIRRLLAQGLSRRVIARRLGISVMTVYRRLRWEPDAAQWAKNGPGPARQRHKGDREGMARVSTPLPPAARRPRRQRSAVTDDAYPDALVRRVPPDFVAVLPPCHLRALFAAAGRSRSAAAAESLRQALLLHAEPMRPPPTSIELMLTEEEERELMEYRWQDNGA